MINSPLRPCLFAGAILACAAVAWAAQAPEIDFTRFKPLTPGAGDNLVGSADVSQYAIGLNGNLTLMATPVVAAGTSPRSVSSIGGYQ